MFKWIDILMKRNKIRQKLIRICISVTSSQPWPKSDWRDEWKGKTQDICFYFVLLDNCLWYHDKARPQIATRKYNIMQWIIYFAKPIVESTFQLEIGHSNTLFFLRNIQPERTQVNFRIWCRKNWAIFGSRLLICVCVCEREEANRQIRVNFIHLPNPADFSIDSRHPRTEKHLKQTLHTYTISNVICFMVFLDVYFVLHLKFDTIYCQRYNSRIECWTRFQRLHSDSAGHFATQNETSSIHLI